MQRDSTTESVLMALYVKKRNLVMAFVLMGILIMIFSAIQFVSFPGDVGETGVCVSLIMCTFDTLFRGVPAGGGVGEYLEEVNPGRNLTRTASWYSRGSFDFFFYIFVTVVILNIIFGIIIDTFGALRHEKEAIEFDRANVCLICSFTRLDFDRNSAEGFEVHRQHEHNPKAYIFYYVHLPVKILQRTFVDWTPCFSQPWPGFSFPRT